MTIQERREIPGGFGGAHTQVRVRVLGADEQKPEGAEVVADDTPLHDWKQETKN